MTDTQSKTAGSDESPKYWCDTCEGVGHIDERLGGEHFSNPKAECPDCDGNGYWIPRATLSHPATQAGALQAEQDLAVIYDAFRIGSKARSIHILRENLSNVLRRSECLSAIERTFFMVPTEPEEDDDGVWGEECLLNWGQDPDEYVRTFREALKTISTAEGERVFLVATGETHDGQETYTRHDARPPLCDAETLYTAPLAPTQPNAAPAAEVVAKIPRGALPTLRTVVALLRENGRFEDEEGEPTDALEDLRDWLESLAAPAAAIDAREQESKS